MQWPAQHVVPFAGIVPFTRKASTAPFTHWFDLL
jgi:hypothetical protein